MGSDVPAFTVDARRCTPRDKELASDIDEKVLEELKEQASQRRTTFIARAGPETKAQAGGSQEIHVDTRKLYFFDPANGQSIYGDRAVAPSSAASTLTT
jgi:hypothetical protein